LKFALLPIKRDSNYVDLYAGHSAKRLKTLMVVMTMMMMTHLRSRILNVVSDASCAPRTSSIVADGLSVMTSQLTGFQLRICTVPIRQSHLINTYINVTDVQKILFIPILA